MISSLAIIKCVEDRLGGRELSSLPLHESLELLELYLLSIKISSGVFSQGSESKIAALRAHIAKLCKPSVPPPSSSSLLPSTKKRHTRPPPSAHTHIVMGINAMQRQLLLQGASGKDGKSSTAQSPEDVELLKSELFEEVNALVGRLKQGGQTTNESLVSNNVSLGDTTGLAEKNLGAVSASAVALEEESKRAWGHTFSLCALIIKGVFAFLLAYVSIQFFAKPTPLRQRVTANPPPFSPTVSPTPASSPYLDTPLSPETVLVATPDPLSVFDVSSTTPLPSLQSMINADESIFGGEVAQKDVTRASEEGDAMSVLIETSGEGEWGERRELNETF